MLIGIYASTGKFVGLGHLKRCMAIAKELENFGHQVEILLDDHLYSEIVINSKLNFSMITDLNKKFRIIIVDKYGLDDGFYLSLRKYCDVLVRMDDASPKFRRDNISDAIINGNPYGNMKIYEGVVKSECQLLVGKDYIPMDRNFCDLRSRYKIHTENRNILVTFGASDCLDYSKDVVTKIGTSFPNKKITLLNGIALQDKIDLKITNVRLLPLVENMQEILITSDIVICSASSICWQLTAVGIPYIAFMTASNQELSFRYIKKENLGICLDKSCINNGFLEKAIDLYTTGKKEQMFIKGRNLIDCHGSKKIAEKLINLYDR